MKRNSTKLLAFLTALIIIFGTVALPASAKPPSSSPSASDDHLVSNIESCPPAAVNENEYPNSMQLPYYEDGTPLAQRISERTEADDYSTVRVLLTHEPDIAVREIRLALYGAYYIDQTLTPIVGTQNQPAIVRFTASNGIAYAYYNAALVYSGSVIDLNRVLLSRSGGYANVQTVPSSSTNDKDYLGSFRIMASGSELDIINVVPTAHYLYGIVPYEINGSWHREAVYAQAIAAKTYAFAYSSGNENYDITSSMAHLGYRGYSDSVGSSFAWEPCREMCGKILFYGNILAPTNFGATNGGETTLPSYAFGSSGFDGAYSVRLDPYDMPNTPDDYISELNIVYGEPVTNANFRSLLNDRIAQQLGHSAELITVTSASVHTRKHPDTTLDLTRMSVSARVNDNGTISTVSLEFDVSLLGTYSVLYKPGRNLRIYWGRATSGGYTVYRCRYGHGLGLSQHGADGRAKDGFNYSQILKFYYPGMDLREVRERDPELPNSYSKQPVAFGTVSASSARMRSGPGTDHSIIDTLPIGTHVDVITETNGWLVCIANNKLGYIRGDLVRVDLFPAPLGAEHAIGYSTVRPGVLDAQLRFGPSEYSAPIFVLYPGVSVEVWHAVGSWYHVRFAGRYAFIHSSKITAPVYGKLMNPFDRIRSLSVTP